MQSFSIQCCSCQMVPDRVECMLSACQQALVEMCAVLPAEGDTCLGHATRVGWRAALQAKVLPIWAAGRQCVWERWPAVARLLCVPAGGSEYMQQGPEIELHSAGTATGLSQLCATS